jgi:hypothetical protein
VNATSTRDELLRAPLPRGEGWAYNWAVGAAALSCAAFGAAALWSVTSKDPYPLGMGQVAANARYAWPLLFLSAWALMLLLVPRFRTLLNLLVAAGVLVGVGFTVLFFVGGGGSALVATATMLVAVARGPERDAKS